MIPLFQHPSELILRKTVFPAGYLEILIASPLPLLVPPPFPKPMQNSALHNSVRVLLSFTVFLQNIIKLLRNDEIMQIFSFMALLKPVK